MIHMTYPLALPMLAGLGPTELLIILAVIVLLFGASKLPELARGSGRALRIFKAETKGLMDDDDDHDKNAAASTTTAEQRQIDAQQRPSSNGVVNDGPSGVTQPRTNSEDTRPPGSI